jgi:4-amino-4-deoxy-L-arabinose transferase-like glycosyltransferase
MTLAFFLWSRIDLSDRLYYVGDGTAVVSLIRLMLDSGNWDPDWYRLLDVVHMDEDIKQLMVVPPGGAYFYHTAGYVMIAASVCKILYAAGLTGLSIPKILHGINLFVQALTLLLLYRIGKQMVNRYVGLLSMIFFTLFPLAAMEAHYERIESWLCLLATALVYVSFRFRKTPKLTSFVMGLLIGLSFATKFSQLYLGIIPVTLFLHFFFRENPAPIPERMFALLAYGGLLIAGIVLAVAVNVPYMVEHFYGYLDSMKGVQAFYTTPVYPYAEEYYSYLGQLNVIGRYFVVTLGAGWMLCFLLGMVRSQGPHVPDEYTRWIIAAFLFCA